MSVITRRLSVPELTEQILEMAKLGVYRESVFEALSPLATKKQIREAIAHAKRFGLHSVADLRDAELGTYYQLDVAKFQALQHTIHSPVHLGSDADLMQRVTNAATAVERMLTIAKSLSLLLLIGAGVSLFTGHGQLGLELLSAAIAGLSIWFLQKNLVKLPQ